MATDRAKARDPGYVAHRPGAPVRGGRRQRFPCRACPVSRKLSGSNPPESPHGQVPPAPARGTVRLDLCARLRARGGVHTTRDEALHLPSTSPNARFRAACRTTARANGLSGARLVRHTPSRICSFRTPCSTGRASGGAARRGKPRPAHRGRSRRAAAHRRTVLQLRCRHPSRHVARRRTEDYLPNYREFYEKRQFPARAARPRSMRSAGQRRSVRQRSPVRRRNVPAFALTSKSARTCGCRCRRARCGARRRDVLANLSASNVTIGKADYRRLAVPSQSAKCIAAYAYAGRRARRIDDRPRLGRPCDDLRERRSAGRVGAVRGCQPRLVSADVDLDRLRQERTRIDELQRLRAQTTRRARATSAASDVRLRAAGGRSLSSGASSAFRTCRPTARAAMSVATRPTTSRSQGLAQRLQATGHRESRHRRLGRSRFDPRADCVAAEPWTSSACRAPTSWPTRCRASRPATAPTRMRRR